MFVLIGSWILWNIHADDPEFTALIHSYLDDSDITDAPTR